MIARKADLGSAIPQDLYLFYELTNGIDRSESIDWRFWDLNDFCFLDELPFSIPGSVFDPRNHIAFADADDGNRVISFRKHRPSEAEPLFDLVTRNDFWPVGARFEDLLALVAGDGTKQGQNKRLDTNA